MKNRIIRWLTGAMTACAAAAAPLLQAEDAAWPKGCSPEEVGLHVAERFLVTPHGDGVKPRPTTPIIYPEVCTWYGALTFAQLSGNKDLTAKLVKRFDPMFGAEASMVPKAISVDFTIFGSIPLEIYMETKEQKYLDMGKPFPDQQWQAPPGTRLSPEVSGWVDRGLSWHSRFWIDDMYMLTLVEVQAARATGEAKYMDRAALEMTAYLDELQKTNGLFYHAPDVPFFWGRGNGWVAAGMSELLRSLPENHPKRARIMEGYKKMMASLLKFQGGDGLWHQLLDHPESFPETSCTGMFTFAMITGVKNGWLDEKIYGPAARLGWLGLVSYINDQADVREVCDGTNKKNDLNYYLTRTRSTGNLHGQAPILWCASAWLRPPEKAAGPGNSSTPAPHSELLTHAFVCTDYTQGKVFVVSTEGNIEWEYDGATNANDIWVLPGGNLLFSTGHGVKEVTREQRVVFHYDSASEIYACQRLADGNTFIGECSAGRLLEVDPDGKIVKELRLLPEGKSGGHTYMRNARRLDNGNYLVAHYGEQIVREYDPQGKVVREIPAAGGPHSVVRLPGGNTLIACADGKGGSRVFEVDLDGKTVWQVQGDELPGITLKYMAGLQRLPNGNTVMSNWLGHNQFGTAPDLIEVTPDKRVVWTFYGHQTIKTISSVQLLDLPASQLAQGVLH